MTFDLILPVYNPAPSWEKRFIINMRKLIDDHLEGDASRINIIIVNDGSTRNFSDESIGTLLESELPLQVICYKENRGKGFALREGVKYSHAPFCIYTD